MIDDHRLPEFLNPAIVFISNEYLLYQEPKLKVEHDKLHPYTTSDLLTRPLTRN